MDKKDYTTVERDAEARAAKRDKKKRKRMHQSGKSVFDLQRLMTKPPKKKPKK